MSFLDLDFNSLYSKLESIVDKKTAAVCENMIRDLERAIKEKDTRFARNEQIYEQNMEAKDKQLLSEQNRFVRLKEFISKHAKCVGCEKKFDTILHIPYVLTCGHTICSYCFFNIPVISSEDEKRYIKYIEETLPAPPSLQRNDSGGSFTGTITRAAAAAAGAVSSVADSLFDDPEERRKFIKWFQKTEKQILAQTEKIKLYQKGFEHIGKCTVCKTPQRGLRYDLLATVNVAKEFSFGKNKRNKKSSKNKKSKSIKRKNKNKKSKRKSIKNIKNKKSKRKSIKRSKNKK